MQMKRLSHSIAWWCHRTRGILRVLIVVFFRRESFNLTSHNPVQDTRMCFHHAACTTHIRTWKDQWKKRHNYANQEIKVVLRIKKIQKSTKKQSVTIAIGIFLPGRFFPCHRIRHQVLHDFHKTFSDCHEEYQRKKDVLCRWSIWHMLGLCLQRPTPTQLTLMSCCSVCWQFVPNKEQLLSNEYFQTIIKHAMSASL